MFELSQFGLFNKSWLKKTKEINSACEPGIPSLQKLTPVQAKFSFIILVIQFDDKQDNFSLVLFIYLFIY